MKIYEKGAMALAALLVAATPATALTVTNGDSESWTIAVTVGETRTEYTLSGGEAASVDCDPSCSVHLVAALRGKDGIGRVTDDSELMIRNGELKVVEQALGHGRIRRKRGEKAGSWTIAFSRCGAARLADRPGSERCVDRNGTVYPRGSLGPRLTTSFGLTAP